MSSFSLFPIRRSAFIVLLLSQVLIFVSYLASMSQGVLFEDSGLFSMVCYYAGVAHPPGYPLYSLLCPPFAHLPFINPAHGVAIFSGLCATVACFLVALIVQRLTNHTWAAVVSALTYAWGADFWAQAIIQEVYSLNALLLLLLLWLAVELVAKPSKGKLFALVLVFFLGVSNHWPLMVLATIGLPFMLMPIYRTLWEYVGSRFGFVLVLAMLLGLSPYLYMWLRSLTDPLISFYGAIDSWERFWFYVSRKGYSAVDNAGGNWYDKLDFLLALLDTLMSRQLTIAGLLLAVVGMWALLRQSVALWLGLLLSLLGSSVLLVLLLNFEFNDFSWTIFRVYPLTSWGVACLFIGFGVAFIGGWLEELHRYAKYLLLLVGLLPGYLFAVNLSENWQEKFAWAHRQAEQILLSLDKNAVLLVHDDTHLPLMYLHLVERIRPDLTVYNTQSLVLGDDLRLLSAFSQMDEKKRVYRQRVEDSGRVGYAFYADELPIVANGGRGYRGERYGVLFKAVPVDKMAEAVDLPENYELVIDASLFNIVQDSSNYFVDNRSWSRAKRLNYAKELVLLLLETSEKEGVDRQNYQQVKQDFLSTPLGKLAYANYWFHHWLDNQEIDEAFAKEQQLAIQLLHSLAPLVKSLPPFEQARYYQTVGKILSVNAVAQKHSEIEAAFLKGVAAYPRSDNLALFSLLEMYAQINAKDKFDDLLQRYPNAGRASAIVQAMKSGKPLPVPVAKVPSQQDQVAGANKKITEADKQIAEAKITESNKQIAEANKQVAEAYRLLTQQPLDPKRALLILQPLLQKFPNNQKVMLLVGAGHLLQKQFPVAREWFERALAKAPNDVDANLNLMRTLYYQQDWLALSQRLPSAAKLLPDHPLIVELQRLVVARGESGKNDKSGDEENGEVE